MVGNFRKGFIFVFVVSQELFTKIKLKFLLSTWSEPCFNPYYLTPTEACQKLKCYISEDARTRQQCKAKSGRNCFYEHPRYKATFLATLEQRAEIAISLCKQF